MWLQPQPPPPKAGCFGTSAEIYGKNHPWLRTRSLEKTFGSEVSGDFLKVTEPGEKDGFCCQPSMHPQRSIVRGRVQGHSVLGADRPPTEDT